jgi:4-amino-4-deoxy-L-arabinose transferase-like glycosyltransferase
MHPGVESWIRRHGVLLAILIAAAVVRLAFLHEASGTLLLKVPLLDGRDYDLWARNLVRGDWGWGEPYWYAPLYPHLLALVYALFGPNGLAPQLLQAALGVATVALVYALGRRLADRPTALVAAALYAGYGPPVLYGGLLLVATSLTLLLLLAALVLWRALERPTAARWLAAGVAAGFASLGRGNLLYLVPAALLLLVREPVPAGGARRAKLAAALLLGTVLVVAPVTLRNLLVGGDLVLISSNAGINLRIGQQVRYGGRFGPVDDLLSVKGDPTQQRALEVEAGRSLKASEVSRRHLELALKEAFDAPLATVVHYARKAYRFWNGYEQPQITSWRVWRERLFSLRLLVVPFALIAAAGLLGFFDMRGRARRFLAVLVGGYFVSLWPFFPTARYRLPLVPLLAVAAAVFLIETVRALRRRNARRSALRITALASGIVLLWPAWLALPHADEAWQVAMHDASRAADTGDIQRVEAAAKEAEALLPNSPETQFRLASYFERIGALEESYARLERAYAGSPGNPLILQHLGINLEHQGRLSAAAAAFAAAAAADTVWADPLRRQADVLRRLGDPAAAIASLRRAIERQPGDPALRSNLASLLAEIGRSDEARIQLDELTRAFPLYLPGWFNLALLEYRAGRIQAARAALAGARSAAVRGSKEQRRQLTQLEKLLAR